MSELVRVLALRPRRDLPWILAAACLGAAPHGLARADSSARPQSLGEIAEKTRRERSASGDKATQAFGDEDLTGRGPLTEASSATDDSAESFRAATPTPDEPASTEAEPRPSNGRTPHEHRLRRDQWARNWKIAMDKAERDLAQAQEDARQCQAASRYFYVPIRVDCTQLPRRLADARARVNKLRRNRYSWDSTENDDDD